MPIASHAEPECHCHTVIRFVWVNAKFGTCTVESVNGTLKLKCANSPLNQLILSLASVPFTLTTVQVPNLALITRNGLQCRQRSFCYIYLFIIFSSTPKIHYETRWILHNKESYALIKKNIKFSSYIRKFRVQKLQSHLWGGTF
jgi:hypothetical protein